MAEIKYKSIICPEESGSNLTDSELFDLKVLFKFKYVKVLVKTLNFLAYRIRFDVYLHYN